MMSPSSARWPGRILEYPASIAGLDATNPMSQNDAGVLRGGHPTRLHCQLSSYSVHVPMFVHLIVIGWLYVVVMMAIAEATNTNGTVLGAIVTLFLYGLGPVALVVYLLGAPGRRKAVRARELAAQEEARRAAAEPRDAEGSGLPDAHGKAAADTVAPVRKEP
jgi:hypothetical protein